MKSVWWYHGIILSAPSFLNVYPNQRGDLIKGVGLTVSEQQEIKSRHPQLQVFHTVVGVKRRGKDDFHLVRPEVDLPVKKEAELKEGFKAAYYNKYYTVVELHTLSQ